MRPPQVWPVPVGRRGPSSALDTLDRIRPALLAGRARSPDGAGRRPSVLILVATANPPSRGGVALIAALRYEIHVVIGAVQHVEPTLIGRVRVIDPAAVLQEHADAGGLGQPPRAEPVVVVELPGLHLLLGERDAIVYVEVAAERREPRKAPAHPFLVGGKLRVGSP